MANFQTIKRTMAPVMFWIGVRIIFAAAVIVGAALGGCSPMEHAQVSTADSKASMGAATTTDITKHVIGDPQPNVTTSTNYNLTGAGSTLSLEIPAGWTPTAPTPSFNGSPNHVQDATVKTTVNEKADLSNSSGSSDTSKWPLWIGLIGGGIGLLILYFAIKAWAKWLKETGAGELAGFVNGKLKDAAHGLRTQATTEPDAQVRADLAAHASNIEVIKGDIAARVPATK